MRAGARLSAGGTPERLHAPPRAPDPVYLVVGVMQLHGLSEGDLGFGPQVVQLDRPGELKDSAQTEFNRFYFRGQSKITPFDSSLGQSQESSKHPLYGNTATAYF